MVNSIRSSSSDRIFDEPDIDSTSVFCSGVRTPFSCRVCKIFSDGSILVINISDQFSTIVFSFSSFILATSLGSIIIESFSVAVECEKIFYLV